MTRKRWKLVVLWGIALVLALVAAGAYVYQTARAAVEEDVKEWLRTIGSDPVREPVVTFRHVQFSSKSWVVIQYYVDYAPEIDDTFLREAVGAWGLREWDVVFPPFDAPRLIN